MMPRPGGEEVLRQALEHDPEWEKRFVFVTGHSDAAARVSARFSGTLLRKPVDGAELSRAIKDCLPRVERRVAAR
jgi:FixJ family two-component response regulator